MKPKIVDNLLPKIIHRNILEDIDKQKLYLLNNVSGEKQPNIKIDDVDLVNNQLGLGTVIYDGAEGVQDEFRFGVYSQILDYMQEAFEIKLQKLFRIRVGIGLNINVPGSHYPHIDFKFPHNTLLYYVNDSDGDTIFYDEFLGSVEHQEYHVQLKNKPTANQAVLFNGLQYHSSSNPTQVPYRAAININFE